MPEAATHSVTVRLPRGMSRPIIGPDLTDYERALDSTPTRSSVACTANFI